MSIDLIIDGGGASRPVCETCRVVYKFKHSYGWECPICKHNSDFKLWYPDCGISWDELEGNYAFLKFMQGPVHDGPA